MKLTISERSNIFSLLPQKEDFTTLKLLRVAREALSFTNEEKVSLKVEVKDLGDGTVMTYWDEKVAEEIGELEIPLEQVVTIIITEALEKLNRDKNLEERYFTLYEKFVVNKDKEE
jgi:hypothetical protein